MEDIGRPGATRFFFHMCWYLFFSFSHRFMASRSSVVTGRSPHSFATDGRVKEQRAVGLASMRILDFFVLLEAARRAVPRHALFFF